MDKVAVTISATTAFVITGGGALAAVVASGHVLNSASYVTAVVFGLMAAAKDVRSLLKLPPVDTTKE